MDVLILSGGLGSRLRPVVSDRPKPMAEIGGRPFLDILIGYVREFGFRRFILCTGHMGDVIRKHYEGFRGGVEIVLSEEDTPLGTAGAIKHAAQHIKSSIFLAMNGDSFCKMDLAEMARFHSGRRAMLTLALVKSPGGKDYGLVRTGPGGIITGFEEKASADTGGLISAGIYIMDRSLLELIPEGRPYSLETGLFPSVANAYGFVVEGDFIDIGTPERFMKAGEILT